MNRNQQGSNEQNRTYSGRENLRHRQNHYDRYEESRGTEPVHMHSRERMRHDHDQNPDRDFHDRHKSYRASQQDQEDSYYEDEQFKRHLSDSAWNNTPGGELTWAEQYRTDGEAHNYQSPLADFDEYPQQGHNLDHRKPRHKDFSGFGPRGYKRSDARIEEEICELLARDHYIDASDIVVAVENGVVKLSGSVNQREDRVEAEMLSESVIGVEDIQNDISVYRKRKNESEEQQGSRH